MPCPSATLTVWASAWLHGAAAADNVLDALHTWTPIQEVVAADPRTARWLDLPGPDGPGSSLVALLAALRLAGAGTGRLLLPVAGDVRGLPPTGVLSPAALRAGEISVVTVGGLAVAELALVPTVLSDPSRSGTVLRWTVFAPDSMPPAPEPTLADAEHALRGAVRQAATALTDLDVARPRPGVRAEIAEALEGRHRPPWPASTPARALRVLQQADEVEAIVGAANTDAPGGALSASATQARAAALRPLPTAVREARRSAVGAAVRHRWVTSG